MIDGQYPSWKKVLPEGLDHTITVSKADFESALKRTSIMASKNGRVQLSLTPGKMTVITPETESGSSKEEIDANYNGEPVEIALNALYITDVLKIVNCDEISIDFKLNQENKVSSALIIRPLEDSGIPYTHVIMPMTF